MIYYLNFFIAGRPWEEWASELFLYFVFGYLGYAIGYIKADNKARKFLRRFRRVYER